MSVLEALSPTTYRASLIGSAGADLVIGGRPELDKFVPNVNAGFRFESDSERYWFNVNAKDVLVGTEKQAVVDGAVRLAVGDVTEVYKLDIDPLTGEQCLKWLRVFARHPGVHVWEHEITCPSGVDFHYQGALQKWELDAGAQRPAEIVGSYAVYCREQGVLMGASKTPIVAFRTGKMGNIYPPTFTDATGDRRRGELYIDAKAGLYRVSVDETWFSKAKFPVVANDTFGNTATQNSSMQNSRGGGGFFAASADGTVTSISVVCDCTGDYSNAGYYGGTSGAIGVHVAHGAEQNINAAKGWQSWNVSGSITSGTSYWLILQSKHVAAITTIYYDAAAGNFAYQGSITYDTWADSPGGYNYAGGNICSIYATYTAGPPPAAVNPLRVVTGARWR